MSISFLGFVTIHLLFSQRIPDAVATLGEGEAQNLLPSEKVTLRTHILWE